MKQLLLIINPNSGTRKAAKNLAEIIAVFNRAGYAVRVHITAGPGDAAEVVRGIQEDVDLLVCCGGDGTLNETITGLMALGRAIPLGYIPAGSTNDFANALHLSSNVIEAAQQIVDGTAHLYDVGRFGGRYFAYVASFGAFTRASYTTPQNIKNALGHVAYLLEGIQELSGIHPIHVRLELEDEVLEDEYLFGAVCNSTSVGGLLTLDPRLVDMGDGQFELLLIRTPRDLQELHECVMALRSQNYDCGTITFRKTSALRVITDPGMTWSLDGERAQGGDLISIENLHRKISLIH